MLRACRVSEDKEKAARCLRIGRNKLGEESDWSKILGRMLTSSTVLETEGPVDMGDVITRGTSARGKQSDGEGSKMF